MERRLEPQLTRTASTPTSVWSVDGSQHNLIRVPSKLSFLKNTSRRRLELYLSVSVILAVVLFLGLCVSIFFAVLKYNSQEDLCQSPQCLRSASNLMDSMDWSVSPCDNFYKFACGRWNKEHFIRNSYSMNDWFFERGWLIGRDVTDYLYKNNSENEPHPVRQARTMYQACLNTTLMEEYGLQTLNKLLEMIGLPTKPPINTKSKQSWTKTLARTRKFAAIDILIGFGISSKPINKTINKLTVATAYDLDLPIRTFHYINGKHKERDIRIVSDEEDEEFFNSWKKYMVKFLKYFFQEKNESFQFNETALLTAAEGVIHLYRNISEMENSENVTGTIYNEVPEEMNITELQSFVDTATKSGVSKINWTEYFVTLYEDVDDIILNLEQNDTILVYKKQYFKLLSAYLEKVDEQVLEMMIWWHVVYKFAIHVNNDLSDLKQLLAAKVMSITYPSSRSPLCSELVHQLMTIAVGYQVINQPDINNKTAKINEMLTNIQNEFSTLIRKLKWMDEETKNLSLAKVFAMRKFIAYPEWMKNSEEMAMYYSNITINETTHLANILSLLSVGSLFQLREIRRTHNSSFADFDPLDINAYYDPSDNSITVPAGILQFPFYDLGLESLNYGGIGTILGHELTHGFDNSGRKYDKEGNLKVWWTNSSIGQYNERTQCYVEEYNNYYMHSINKTVDGNLTLGENLADNGGLREALMAYRTYVGANGKEPGLPGLQNYTHEQLFFLSFANMWCSDYTDYSLLESLKDEHSPNFVRVEMSLKNLREFAEAWSCPPGSNMNPEKRCHLWVD